MSDYFINSPFIVAGPVTATHTAPAAPLGIEVDAIDRAQATSNGAAWGKFVYARGSNVGTVGAIVSLQNGSAVMVSSAGSVSNFPLGIAAGLLSATNVYGWVQVQGRCDYARGTNVAMTAGIPRYLGGTAGIVFSDVVAGNRIQGLNVPFNQTSTAGVSAAGVFDLNRPFIAGLTAAF